MAISGSLNFLSASVTGSNNINVDFVGLNTLIVDPVSGSSNQLGYELLLNSEGLVDIAAHTNDSSLYYNNSVDAIGGKQATSVDAIDTTGYVNSNADASFTISIPTAAGGLGGTAVTILLDEDKDDVTPATAAADTITIGTNDAAETDAQAASFLINAINGVTAGRFIYAASGNGQAGHDLGITAKQGTSDTQITLTMDAAGGAGNITSALASVSGHDIIDVTAFTNGTNNSVQPNELNSLLLNRNGPYQHAMWKQYRGGDHPVARALRLHNARSLAAPVPNSASCTPARPLPSAPKAAC